MVKFNFYYKNIKCKKSRIVFFSVLFFILSSFIWINVDSSQLKPIEALNFKLSYSQLEIWDFIEQSCVMTTNPFVWFHIFATWFQTLPIWSNITGCNAMGIRKLLFVIIAQLLCMDFLNMLETVFSLADNFYEKL